MNWRLLWQARTLVKAVEEQNKMAYDWKIGVAKALRDFFITSVAVGGAAVAAFFAVPANIAAVTGFLPETVQHALIPIISAGFVFALNWMRERNK